ncbi:MAG TPA: glucoamylase family protein [Terriglobia bacterium]|nr:glucoamylase family protein [Terriglobia bacterium]
MLRRISETWIGGSLLKLGMPTLLSASTEIPQVLSPRPLPPIALSPEDDLFLEELERVTVDYFWEQANPQTGLVKDRCNVRAVDHTVVASIAATGFGLTALCIGDKRKYIHFFEARRRALNTLMFLWEKMPQHRGFFYHFADIRTGERLWDSEVSSVDTAILLCGVLACAHHFSESGITDLARAIFNRVDWTWLSMDTVTGLLPHGWVPENGFLPYRWDYYSELMMMYLLGLGSSSHPLPKEAWDAWKRTTFDYEGLRYIGSFAPLFVHQYSQAWFDFRGKRDRYADYFQNSIIATDVHRRFCLELGKQFPDYSDDLWGITASDSPYGYVAWGGPPEMGPIDGTVVPSAPGGSLPFIPDATLRVLRNIRARYGDGAYSKYGFINAFNPLKGWYDNDAIGIDTGITLLMAENLRTGFVWETFMKSPEARRGMERAGFKPYTASGAQETGLTPLPGTTSKKPTLVTP